MSTSRYITSRTSVSGPSQSSHHHDQSINHISSRHMIGTRGVPGADCGRRSVGGAWDDGRPGSGYGLAFNPQDDTGIGVSVPHGVGGGRRRGAPSVAESGRLLRRLRHAAGRVPRRRPGRPRRRQRGRSRVSGQGRTSVQPPRDVCRSDHRSIAGAFTDPLSASFEGPEAGRTEPVGHIVSGAERVEPTERASAEKGAGTGTHRAPVAGFDLTFSPSKSISTAWALADADTKARISACHRRAIEVVLTYAEREVFHSARARTAWSKRTSRGWWPRRSPIGIRGPATPSSMTMWWWPTVPAQSRTASGARSTRGGLFKSVVMLGELHQGVLADLLNPGVGVGLGRKISAAFGQGSLGGGGVPETLLAEF